MQVLETTGSWTYASSTIRQANAAAANQLDFVRGLDEEVIEVTAGCLATIGTALDAFRVGIGLDSTTAFAVDCLCGNHRASAGGVNEGSFMFAKYCGRPGLGRHLLTWLEQRSVGTGTISFYGNTNSTSGITASSRT
jgi:hypothetical protein